jgi:hypothetical protein
MIRPATGPQLIVPVNEHDHILGPITAPVTMVEYGDYECTYCGQAHHVLKQLRQLLGHRLCFVFRHFPLTTVPYGQIIQMRRFSGGYEPIIAFPSSCAPRRDRAYSPSVWAA